MPFKLDAGTDAAIVNHLVARLSAALVPAVEYAKRLAPVDTGDLRASIRQLPITIEGPLIKGGIVAGGVIGKARGEMVHYADEQEEEDSFLRAAMLESNWEQGIADEPRSKA